MFTHYKRALDECQPYLLATSEVAPFLEWEPLGIDIRKTGTVLDPQHQDNAVFLHLLQNLDRLAFGAFGMAMPKWVFYDCGVMPSTVFGFCGPAESLEPWVHRALEIPAGYTGLVPLTIFIAIPTLEEGTWFTHTLCSINTVCTGAAPAGLQLLSVALGVRILKVKTLLGTCQWRSRRLDTFVGIGPLELITAYTPAHSVRRTLTWRLHLRRFLVEAALIKPGPSPAAPAATHVLDVDDEKALITLQREIEAGIPYSVVGAPMARGSIVQVPLKRGAA